MSSSRVKTMMNTLRRSLKSTKSVLDPRRTMAVERIQAVTRGRMVRRRAVRLQQSKLVAARKAAQLVASVPGDFMFAEQILQPIHKHSEEELLTASNNIAPTRRTQTMKAMALALHKLMHTIEELSLLAACESTEECCTQAAALMCELFDATNCDIYPIGASDTDECICMTNTFFLPVRFHGLLWRGTSSGPTSIKDVNINLADQLSTIEWYDHSCGLKETLVRHVEADKVLVLMRERYLKPRLVNKKADLGHAMMMRLTLGTADEMRQATRNEAPDANLNRAPGRWSTIAEGADGEKQHTYGMLLLARPPGAPAFSDDDEYLASLIAPHISRTLLACRQRSFAAQAVVQTQRLHKLEDRNLRSLNDLIQAIGGLYACDEFNVYALDAERGQHTRGQRHALRPLKKGIIAVPDSVAGMDALCSSTQSILLVQNERPILLPETRQAPHDVRAFAEAASMASRKIHENAMSHMKRPTQAIVKSMLCVAVVVHKETLGISNEIDEQPTLPVLLQWVNKRGTPFSNQDLAISRRLRATMQRLADAKQKERQITLLQERFVLGDARRVALMESAKMLAKKMEMSHLFSAVMVHAKELMEVDRSTLFMYSKQKEVLLTIVSDGSDPITIPSNKGLAGAAYTTGQLINIVDAYSDSRFNPDVDLKTGYRTKSVLCFPILNSEDEVIGVIQLINKLNGMRFNTSDEELIAAFCAQLAVSIENLNHIDEMKRSKLKAEEQRQSLLKFLEVIKEVCDREESFQTVCQKAQEAACECTKSQGSALYMSQDSSETDLIRLRRALGIEDISPDSTISVALADGTESLLVQASPQRSVCENRHALNLAARAQYLKDVVEDAYTTHVATLDEIDEEEPPVLRCLCVPLAYHDANGVKCSLGVLAVWGSDQYGDSDVKVLSSLATVTSFLLRTKYADRDHQKELVELHEKLRIEYDQRRALFRYCSNLGAAQEGALYEVASSLASALNCASCTLWLIKDAGSSEQRLVTELNARQLEMHLRSRYRDTERLEDNKYLRIKFHGQGIVGAAISSAEIYNVSNAHLHFAYDPNLDEVIFQLLDNETALMAVPLTDHFGRVIGALHASGKYPARMDKNDAQLKQVETRLHADALETPSFSNEDVEFLKIVADKIATEIELLAHISKSPVEILDQQAIAKELRKQLAAMQADIHTFRSEHSRMQTRAAINEQSPVGASHHKLAPHSPTRFLNRNIHSPDVPTHSKLDSPNKFHVHAEPPTDILRSQEVASELAQHIELGPDLCPVVRSADSAKNDARQVRSIDFERYTARYPSVKNGLNSPKGSEVGSLPPVSSARMHAVNSTGGLNKSDKLGHMKKTTRGRGNKVVAQDERASCAPHNPEGVWDELYRTLRDL
ncbi:hypothetical protein AB1Y20_020965 [Prymnesium parvum]|uniref:GAF domain-containing protein n=1 Tax=Prymnesium parvum TaxID=97485 RepID=A0AB34JKQ7_PRYPA